MTHLPDDPIEIAQALGLDPVGRGRREVRMQCPRGCDEGRQRVNYGCSMHTSGDKAGLWHCHRCGEGGHIAANQGTRDPSPHDDTTLQTTSHPDRDGAEPIDVPEAWRVLGEQAFKLHRQVERWALARGWPPELASTFSKLPDVLWAPTRPTGHKDADRLAQHARRVDRPLMFALRDQEGVVRSIMRRAVGDVEGPKSMCAASVFCPVEGPRLLGHLPDWIGAARANKVVVLCEGEADFGALSALARLEHAPVTAVLGCPSHVGLIKAAQIVAPMLKGPRRARVVCVPHLGDKDEVGLKKMATVSRHLAKEGQALVSTLHLPRDKAGKADFAQTIEQLGLERARQELEEVAPRVVFEGRSLWCYSDRLLKIDLTESDKGEPGERVQHVASMCWPVGLTYKVGQDAHGVRYRFHTRHGVTRYGILSASGWSGGADAYRAAAEASERGVRILPDKGGQWASALGHWAEGIRDAPQVLMCGWPGWHRWRGQWVYVAGESVFGAPWIYDGDPIRTLRAGTHEAWRKGIKALATTRGIQISLGVAFAGALLDPLGIDPFFIHIFGDSSEGKSRTGYAALSVWGPRRMEIKWSATVNRAEYNLAVRSGAFVLIDELKHMEPKDVTRFVHRFGDGVGRQRLNRASKPMEAWRWRLAGLSTGENPISAWIGDELQGGQTVRAIDLPLELSEATVDRAHSDAIDTFVRLQHGTAGDVWVRWLAGLDDEGWAGLAERFESYRVDAADLVQGNEDGRILGKVALCAFALELAHEAGVVDLFDNPHEACLELLGWTIERIKGHRGTRTNPRQRAWAALRHLFETRPGAFPCEEEYRNTRGNTCVYALSETQVRPRMGAEGHRREPSGAILTTRMMLSGCKPIVQAGIEANKFLDWLLTEGVATRLNQGKTTRIAGVSSRWLRIDLTSDPPPG